MHDILDPIFDETTRGVPAGQTIRAGATPAVPLNPLNGSLPLPVLTIDLDKLEANAKAFLAFAGEQGVLVAPHAKTPMIPELLKPLVDQGAWGLTVATVQQLTVMARSGVRRLIFGSPPGGTIGCRHLAAALSAAGPEVEFYVFLDSVAGAKALAGALEEVNGPRVGALVEVGFGRTGARTLDDALAIRDAVQQSGGRLTLAGVACYEAAAVTGSDDVRTVLPDLFALVSSTVDIVAEKMPENAAILVSAGGSLYFNEVIAAGRAILDRHASAVLVLRSGSLFFSDDGPYDRAFADMAGRGLDIGDRIGPTLSIWAEILSRPERGLAIAGFGHREAPNDLGLPVIKNVFRNGVLLKLNSTVEVARLNDHHAFLSGSAIEQIEVGDVVEVGICHPCTTLQRWRLVLGARHGHAIERAFATFFG